MRTELQIVSEFIDILIEHYDLQKEELHNLWTSSHPVDEKPLSLDTLSLKELKQLCKDKRLKVSGTKQELIQRLQHEVPKDKRNVEHEVKESVEHEVKDEVKEDNKKGKKEKKPKKSLSSEEKSSKPRKSKKKLANVIQKIIEDVEPTHIRRNIYNNFEHMDTKLVFDETTKKVIGRQGDSGDILPLSKTDIETCKEYNFDVDIPDLLE